MLILLKDECFHKITITDIVKRAGVSRTAYYRNYTSKKVLSHLEEIRMFETYCAFFWIGAIYNVAAVWLRNGMQQSIEEMAEICYQIVNNVLEPCLLYKEP